MGIIALRLHKSEHSHLSHKSGKEKYVKPQETICDMFPVISSTLSRTQESMLVCQGYYHQMVVEAESLPGEDQCAPNMLLQSLRLAL
jgi:DNA polymerase III alpha subunit